MRRFTSIELLEPRIAPAAAFRSVLSFSTDGRIATYTDFDGDDVTIAISNGKLSEKNIVLSEPNEIGGQRLLLLDLNGSGLNRLQKLSITAEGSGGGNGHVNVLRIQGGRIDNLNVDGDLAKLTAGTIGELRARSLGAGAFDPPSFYPIRVFHLGHADILSDVVTGVDVTRAGKFVVGGTLTGSIRVNIAETIHIKGDVRGTEQRSSGLITIDGFALRFPTAIHFIRIDGSLMGGSGEDSGGIIANRALTTARGGWISKIEIGGSVFGSKGDEGGHAGSILAAGHIHKIEIHGSIIGSASHPVMIGADGLYDSDPALGRVYVGGDVRYAQFIAGNAFGRFAPVTSASIKGIMVEGDWIASSVAAGAQSGKDQLIGTRDDVGTPHDRLSDFPLHSPEDAIAHIGAIIVYGNAYGTHKRGDSFGIVAQQIGLVYIGGQMFTFDDGPGDKEDFFHVSTGEPGPDGASSDFTIREVELHSGRS